jgi:hypothetical protein
MTRRDHDRDEEQRRKDDALRAELFAWFAEALRAADVDALEAAVEATR